MYAQLCPTLFAPWTITRQAPLSMGISRQEYWSGLPFPSPGDLPDPGIKPMSLASPALAGRLFITGAIWEAQSLEEQVKNELNSRNCGSLRVTNSKSLDSLGGGGG